MAALAYGYGYGVCVGGGVLVAVAGLVPVMVGRDALVSVAVGSVPVAVGVADGVSDGIGAGGTVALGCAVSVGV